MTHFSDLNRSSLADSLDGLARQKLDPARGEAASRLAMIFLAGLPAADVEEAEPGRLFAVIVGLLGHLKERPPGQPRLRVFDPDLEKHGWTSPHTAIEIVNDDMPFLVDSVAMELARRGIAIHLLVHPVISASRDESGRLVELGSLADGVGRAESVMHILVDRQEVGQHADLAARLGQVLADVRAAVVDWQPMRAVIRAASEDVAKLAKTRADSDETVAFLDWLHDDHFSFLGYRRFVFSGEGDSPKVTVDADAGLGILRDSQVTVFDDTVTLAQMPAEIRSFLTAPGLLMVTKSTRHATVHRPVHMDVIGVKQVNKAGKVVGLHAFLGLFTSAAYTRNPSSIPLLRKRVAEVQARAGFAPFSHDSKALVNILETYPRDELFQIGEDRLYRIALGILHLQERPRVALFVRPDDFGRFVSCLVYLPRDRYDTPLRLAVTRLLEQAYGGHLDAYYTQVADGPLARLHVVIRTQPGTKVPDIDESDLERRLADAARSWADQLQDALIAAQGEAKGLKLARRWRDAFAASYRERHPALAAVADIDRLEAVLAGADLGLNLYRPVEAAEHEARLKLLRRGQTVALSDILPILEAMGLRVIAEVPHEIHAADQASPVWIHDFQLESADGTALDLAGRGAAFEEALARIWRGEAESDGFNRLVLTAGLAWRQVVILRAYAKYLRQAGYSLSQANIERALAANPAQTVGLVTLFEALFDPDHRAGDPCFVESQTAALLDQVDSADDDRILRRFLNLIRATLRTNFYLDRPWVSFKLDSRAIDDLPAPRPWVEIWVYSPRVEAIHLRGGRVARGGIRWSDRRDDFRTEILGLMKAQMVKNAVIVPVGAKGGFVVKQPPAEGGREALLAEGIACYQAMMRGLLDVTDTLKGGSVMAPDRVVRRDGDDPYLVVAADKGTATFSDIANSISLEVGFWLGDAFASGGSKGYDHKAMGITARGAWEAVKRHFREIGIDTQTQDFTCIGVGDMSGDVFGNGMLCSPHIKLVAAFNHAHIFIDPDPDPAAAFAERERLFKAVKSWPDYDQSRISTGGGIFSRAAKSIPVSPAMAARFGIEAKTVTPAELIRILLCAQVDLLFFGGIGTYVKAREETNTDVGDRANDQLRVNASDLRAKVLGEGANLGMTQKARIEAALAGIRLNTDAIDNSAGVDTSDHEVNIKILVDDLVAAGDLTAKQRDALLSSMTDEVAALVLRDNYLQTQAISVMEANGPDLLDGQGRFMRLLEKAGRLDRALEFLPGEDVLTERAARRKGLVRPELAVLLAYSKIWLHDAVLGSNLPDDPFLAADLRRYFPTALGDRFANEITRHRLRREIVATTVTNSMINRVGAGFVLDMMERTGFGAAEVARAYIVARDAYGLREVWRAIEALDGQAPASVQIAMLTEANRLLERATAWVLRHVPAPFEIGAAIAEFAPGVAAIDAHRGQALPPETAEMVAARTKDYVDQGVPEAVAVRVAGLIVLASALDVVRIAGRRGLNVEETAQVYFAAGSRFGLGWLRLSAQRLGGRGHWDKLAAVAAIEELYSHQQGIANAVLAEGEGLEAWATRHQAEVERVDSLLAELRAAPQVDLSMLSVINRQLRALAEAGG
ncbi:NAD-glutamate dehydrogenase [Magnetospirillum moscoviense]|uniref:NAD-glutamate dehydrogenase n=1 Tax=Magnetospirillum moscoviense TaxID=1437059 RepID=A0A178MVK2_9PROT|nr:NAD-glutamate dehydrogenase [Magnetospirillum moscoviense]OAN53074.1 NAD-glutamate dehydrogenase [Magnetospirillum moscoviense]